MKKNKTSEAVENLLDGIDDPQHEARIDEDTVACSIKDLKAVADRYKKMESALEDIVWYQRDVYDHEDLDGKAADEFVELAHSALSFNPLV